MTKNTALIFIALLGSVIANNYKGYKIYELLPNDEQQSDVLYNISQSYTNIDFLTLSKMPNYTSRALVAPDDQLQFESLLAQINYKIVNQDVSESIKEQQVLTPRFGFLNGHVTFLRYMRYKEIYAYLDKLAEKYPNLVTVQTVGKTFQGRTLKTITITQGQALRRKPVILIDAGIHAREWIAPAAALYIIQQLVEKHQKYANLLEKSAFVILPLVNADGYEFTHKKNRFWRKTMKPSGIFGCVGTDINRNFGFHWGEVGSSDHPCTEIYQGRKPFSEIETQILQSVMMSYRGRCKMYLSLHSFGSYLFHPFAHTKSLPKNWRLSYNVAKAGADAILKSTGQQYAVGTSSKLLYPASGGSTDYAFAKQDVPVVMVMELPAGGQGFDPSPLRIKSFVTETWTGVRVMVNKVIAQFPRI